MLLNLILDGNYLLSKLVYTLHKNNLLHGALSLSLEKSIDDYRRLYPFTKIYLVSDSRNKSWRKQYLNEYKETRKKNTDIDWGFVYETYEEFKRNKKNIIVLESPGIEGDDWISMIVNNDNKKSISNLIVTNDYDIKQLVTMNLEPLYINFISNEIFNNKSIFLPMNSKLFIDKVRNIKENIFDISYNGEFLDMFDKLTTGYKTVEVDNLETLIIKIISGDSSDNIKSVYQIKSSNGKVRGIGERGAKHIYDDYMKDFGEISLSDPNLFENLADIICEKKKISKSYMHPIVERITENFKMIYLDIDKYPTHVIDSMNTVWSKQLFSGIKV